MATHKKHIVNKDQKRQKLCPERLQQLNTEHYMHKHYAKLRVYAQQMESYAEKFENLLSISRAEYLQRKQHLPRIQLNTSLPVATYADTLIKAIQTHQVIVVAGETGSGKTTQLPQIALLAGRGLTGLIGHTQPRRIAARAVAERIAEELQEPLGQSVAFKVRFNEAGADNAYIKVMTDGILLSELEHDRNLNAYDTLIIDEAHERSLNIDFLLGYIKTIIKKRPQLKVIITSATLDVERFSAYFSGAPIISVEGRSYPVDVRYRPLGESLHSSEEDCFDDIEDALPRAVVNAVDECLQDAKQKGKSEFADILVFASTEAQIHVFNEVLSKYGPKHTHILPLYARLSLAEQQRVFDTKHRIGRRIILATNVAETALTVPNIHYVVDTGFARISKYSHRARIQRLPIEPISQAAANQRKGRCGRIAEGVCIRLYSESDFLARPLYTPPEILRTNLAAVILRMAALHVRDIHQFGFIDPPEAKLLNEGVKLLLELGAIHAKTSTQIELTKIGQRMALMPIDPRLARMLVAAEMNDSLRDVLVIVSALSVQDVRERPEDKKAQADQKHALFKHEHSDFMFFLNVWQQLHSGAYPSERSKWQFARQHFLSGIRVREWRHTHVQLAEVCRKLGVRIGQEETAYEHIHKALLTGLLGNIAHKTLEKGEYLSAFAQKARLFPGSVLSKSQTPWVMASEKVETTQVYLRTVAKIEPEWIMQCAKPLLKFHYFEPHWVKKLGRVQAYAQVSVFGLIVEPKRPVFYEQVDMEVARNLFIREALVQAKLGVEPPFLKHNMRMVQDIQRLEEKVRRHNILVDEEVIFAWYDQRLPADIASRHRFEAWRHEVEAKNARFLYFAQEDLVAEALPDVSAYPTHIQTKGIQLPAHYVFKPNEIRDGVVIKVPATTLAQLQIVDLAWGVAAWRSALLEALLRSLPKAIRKCLVPIPNTVARILADGAEAALTDKVLEWLCTMLNSDLRAHGVQLQSTDFDVEQIPAYLLPYIEVVNASGQVIGGSKNIMQLQQAHAATPELHAQVHAVDVFPTQFSQVVTQQYGQVALKQYQALVPLWDDFKDWLHVLDCPLGKRYPTLRVEAHVFQDVQQATYLHGLGCMALYESRLATVIKQLIKQIPKSMHLQFAGLGSSKRLEHMVVWGALRLTFDQMVWTSDAFLTQFDARQASFLTQGVLVIALLEQVISLYQRIRRKMLMLDMQVYQQSLQDIEQQLDSLSLDQWIWTVPTAYWQDYPRYLTALDTRLTRLEHAVDKDIAALLLLAPLYARIKRITAPNIQDYRFFLEELRINLFAQPMKTKMPVSIKRADKLWEECTA